MIFIGTSGFSYRDWVGPFYPAGTRQAGMLAFYARRFDALEVNFTSYRLPAPGQLVSMAERCGGRVTFSVKAWQGMTHTGEATAADFAAFRAALDPLAAAGVLGAVLLQFPWSFRPGEAGRARVLDLAERLRPLPLVAEFRHRSWVREETFRFLRREGIGFCCVDEPQMDGLLPPTAVATGPTACVRFHGRNAAQWWRHEDPKERYDYLYAREELAAWVPRIRGLDRVAAKTFVFMNNHAEAKAVQNAEMLREMLAAG